MLMQQYRYLAGGKPVAGAYGGNVAGAKRGVFLTRRLLANDVVAAEVCEQAALLHVDTRVTYGA